MQNLTFKTCHTDRTGFTLIELLVVISILALLLSILMPSLNKARESGRAAVCGSNMKQLGLAQSVYAVQNLDFYASNFREEGIQGNTDVIDWNLVATQSWAKGLYPIMAKNWKAYACPTAKPYTPPDWGVPPAFPPQLSEKRPGVSYIMSDYCSNRKVSRIRKPSGVVLFWERSVTCIVSSRYPTVLDAAGKNTDFTALTSPVVHGGKFEDAYLPVQTRRKMVNNAKPNYTFADGHVERCIDSKIWKLSSFWQPN